MADSVMAFTVDANDEMKNMYLNFSIANEVYGIAIQHVLQIVGMQEITEMPEMPPYMKGFVNLRGNVIPVVSMRARFGKPEEAYTERACIVVTHVGSKEIGLLVDAIQETLTIEPENISQPPSIENLDDRSYIVGVARLPGERTSILVNVLKLFDGQA